MKLTEILIGRNQNPLQGEVSYRLCGDGQNTDHVYFVHPSTDVSVDILTDISVKCQLTYQPMLDRYVGQCVDRHSADISVKMCRSTY